MLLFRPVRMPRSLARVSRYYTSLTPKSWAASGHGIPHGKVIVHGISMLVALSQISLLRPRVPKRHLVLHRIQTGHGKFAEQKCGSPQRLHFTDQRGEDGVNLTGEKNGPILSMRHFGRHHPAVEPPDLTGRRGFHRLGGHRLGNRSKVRKKSINRQVGLSVFLSPLGLRFRFTRQPNLRSQTGAERRKVGGPSCTHHDKVRVDDGPVAKLHLIVDERIDERAVDGDIAGMNGFPVIRDAGQAKTRIGPKMPVLPSILVFLGACWVLYAYPCGTGLSFRMLSLRE